MARFSLPLLLLAALGAPLAAQVALPGVAVPRVGSVLGDVGDLTGQTLDRTARQARDLARSRLQRIDRLVRSNRSSIERDARGEPARRGELLLIDAGADALRTARGSGYRVLETVELAELGFSVTRLQVPTGRDLDEAEEHLSALIPEATFAPDNLHFPAGETPALAITSAVSRSAPGGVAVGMIDGAPGKTVAVTGMRGFAAGAPYPSNHGSAVASLLASEHGGPIRVADVYGTDKAGGNALAIARGLGLPLYRQPAD